MRIERLRVAGFGRLRGEIAFDPERCSLIVAPNESGKSTLAAALVAGLYGLPPDRRSKHNPIPARDAYRPWDGGPYAISVEIRLGDDRFTLHRDFATDHTAVIEGRSGTDVAERYRGEGGRIELLERLVGLDRDDFVRSALVMQDEIDSIREGGDVTLRLQKFATSLGGDITAGEAVECLEESLRRYPGTQLQGPGKVETEIRRLDERLDELRARQARLEADHDAARADLDLLGRLADRERELAADLHRLDYLRTRAIVAEIDRQIQAQEQAASERDALAAEADQLAAYRKFPLEAGGEINEIKGKIDELDARIAEARRDLEDQVAAPLREARADRARLVPAGALGEPDVAALEAISVRLGDLRDQLREARQAVSEERSRVRRSGVDVRAAAALNERFRALAPEDLRFLEGFRERLLDLESRRRAIQDAAPRSAGAAALVLPLGLGAALTVAGAVLWGLAGRTATGAALVGGGLLAIAAAALRARPRAGRSGGEPAEARALREEAGALRGRAAALAARIGAPDADALVAEFRRREDLRRRTGSLAEREEAADRVQEGLRRARQEAAAVLARAGRETPAGKVRRRDVVALREDLREVERLRRREQDLAARERRGAEEIAALEARRAALAARMRQLLASAGIDAGDGAAAEALRRFDQESARARRYAQIAQELLPAAAAKVAPPEWLRRRRDEKRTMEELVDEIRKRGSPEGLPEPEHSSNHYVLEFKRADDELRSVQRQRRETFARVGDVLRRYREEGPVLAEERARHEAARARAERFRRAVTVAAERLRAISRESYEEWATALNERANRTLVHLNPAYRDPRFDTDLSFTLEEVATGRRLSRDEVDAHLSAGARDQIYLAVRLAVSDYFSAGRFRLPLVLDEPFAAADDERFDRALQFLAERVSRRHQVILLSCHEDRHAAFRARHPDLFDARVARVDLPALEADPA